MQLKDIGEFGFIERIRPDCLIRPEGVVRAIGDDAAVFRSEGDRLTPVTTDMLVEKIHFLRDAVSGFTLGRKALAVNLSDIAAMGGTACQAFVSIAVPEACPVEYLEEIYRGMKHLAAEHGINILGGDTTGSKSDLVVNITVVGSVAESKILFRDAARIGDVVFSTGWLGDSRAGLHLISNRIAGDEDFLKALIEAHLSPQPCLREGRFLASFPATHAAIDVSDGLTADLGHIMENSRVGARLDIRRLPLSPELRCFCDRFALDPVEMALSGGEDYTLLVTVDPAGAGEIARQFEADFGRPLFAIGEITTTGILERMDPDGSLQRIVPAGWDHFRAG
jgi:thiamine-monophosphate kinase